MEQARRPRPGHGASAAGNGQPPPRPRTPSPPASVAAWMQVESPSKSVGMFDSLSGLTKMLQISSQAESGEQGSGRRATQESGFDPFSCTAEVGNATARGERTENSYTRAEIKGDGMGNGKVTSEHGEGRAGATGARTRPHDTRKTSSQLPERAWAPELTAAASNKAKTQTIAKGESMPTQPANWQAASGGAPYGASPSTRPHSRKFADDLSSNSHGLTMVEKRSAGGGSEGDTSAGGRTDSRYIGNGSKHPTTPYSDTSLSHGPTSSNTTANRTPSQISTDVPGPDDLWMPRTHLLRKIIGEIGIEVPVSTQGSVDPFGRDSSFTSGGEFSPGGAASLESTRTGKDKGEKFISEAAKGSRQESTRSGRRIVML